MHKTLRDLKAEADAEPLDLNWDTLDDHRDERLAFEELLTYTSATMNHAELMYLRMVHGEEMFVVGKPGSIEGEERDEWIARMEAELIDRYKLIDVGYRYVSVTDLLTK